ncbi:hypothetical protein H8E07_15760 [bacterium]|nr:hypothetical protein [bacterium]
MFAVSSSLHRASYPMLLALAAVAFIGLAGCGGEEEVDPYVYTTLERVMAGDTLSNDFLFEIDAPTLDYAKGDVGIVRKGNQLQFVVGPDIENSYASYAGSVLGVQKRFNAVNSTTHLFLMRYRNGEMVTPIDSVTSYMLPDVRTISKNELETPGAPLPDLDWQRESKIKEFLPVNEGDALLKVQSIVENFVYMPRHDLSEEQLANPTDGDYAWYAVFPKSTFRIVELEEGAPYMLELLKAQNLPLVGSFSLVSHEPKRVERRKTHGDLGHVCGTMKINWFRYANTYIAGS